MHILYLHQYFRTPAQGGAIRSYYLATALVQAGHEVTLITSHNQPEYQVQQVDGITVHYLPVPYDNRFSTGRRSWSFLRFLFRSTWLGLRLPRPDLVFATSTPLTIGVPALLLKWLRDLPYVFEVRDLWPEAPIQLGYIRSKPLIWLLRQFEQLVYRQARQVVALSPGMAAGVQAAAPAVDVALLPNMADCSYYQPGPKPAHYRELQVQEYFVISYTGALGRANQVRFLLELAAACQQAALPVLVFIAGTGAEEAQLRQQAQALQLRQVYFLGHLERAAIRELLLASDATYTSFDTLPVLQTNSPNKFFDSLAAGKLNIVNTQGWLRELVEQHRCGLYADPKWPAEAADQLRKFITDPELLRQYQQNARHLAEQAFSREKISADFVRLLEEALR